MANQTQTQSDRTIQDLQHRVRQVLRRANRKTTDYRFKDLHIDLRAHRVWRGESEVDLTPREYALLETLVLNRNMALTRGQLLSSAWGYDYIGESRTVDKVGYRLNTRGPA